MEKVRGVVKEAIKNVIQTIENSIEKAVDEAVLGLKSATQRQLVKSLLLETISKGGFSVAQSVMWR
jgi:hypothetical protein